MSSFEITVLIGLAMIWWNLWALAKGLDAIESLLKQINSKMDRD